MKRTLVAATVIITAITACGPDAATPTIPPTTGVPTTSPLAGPATAVERMTTPTDRPTTSTAAPATITTTSTAATTTTTAATTTTAPTFATLPEAPTVTTAWSIRPGDLLVAGIDGVTVVRDGTVVGRPVTTPVEAAVADPRGNLLITTPDPQAYPTFWPGLYSAGANAVWLVTADGTADVVFEADDVDERPAHVTIHSVADIETLSAAPSLLITHEVGASPFPRDQVRGLPLDGSTFATILPFDTPDEGGVTGIGGLSDGTFVMATESDGGAALTRWTAAGVLWIWGSNHVHAADGNLVATTTPVIRRVAYALTPFEGAARIAVFDLDSRREVLAVVPEVPETRTYVKRISASDTTVAISRITWIPEGDDVVPVYLPVLLLDVATGSLTEAPLAGVGTLVP